jgi:hypothetical protein
MTMTDTVWLSVAPMKSELTAWFTMEDRAAPELERSRNAMAHRGGSHLDPILLPQRAVERKDRKAKRMANLFMVNGFLCMTENTAAVLRQHDLGSGGLYPLDLVRSDGVTPVEGQFWALNFGAKKNALAMEESRSVDGPYANGNCTPELWVKDDDFAVTRAALDAPDLWGDKRVETGFFVSPRLGAALHKAGLAKVFHLMRCRIV